MTSVIVLLSSFRHSRNAVEVGLKEPGQAGTHALSDDATTARPGRCRFVSLAKLASAGGAVAHGPLVVPRGTWRKPGFKKSDRQGAQLRVAF